MDFLLGIHESHRHRVGQEFVALFFEVGDLLTRQGLAVLLLSFKTLSLFIENPIEALGLVVGLEVIDPFAYRLVIRLIENRLAKFHRLLLHHNITVFVFHGGLNYQPDRDKAS